MKKTRIDFASLLAYVPGKDPAHAGSQRAMTDLKHDGVRPSGRPMSEVVADMLLENLAGYKFSRYFGRDTVLIPAPRHSRRRIGELWPAQRLAMAMARNGLGRDYICLHRKTAVPRASTAKTLKDRPTAQRHYETIGTIDLPFGPKRIVLVDDVITTGATVLACANLLEERFRGSRVDVFVAMRAVKPSQFTAIEAPRVASVRLSGRYTERNDYIKHF